MVFDIRLSDEEVSTFHNERKMEDILFAEQRIDVTMPTTGLADRWCPVVLRNTLYVQHMVLLRHMHGNPYYASKDILLIGVESILVNPAGARRVGLSILSAQRLGSVLPQGQFGRIVGSFVSFPKPHRTERAWKCLDKAIRSRRHCTNEVNVS
jgi:hypothetical protein